MQTQEILRIDALQKFYGASMVLNEIHMLMNRGDRAALIGENGSGKTSLARLICGQQQPDAGQIRLASGAQLGFLPQEVQAIPGQTLGQHLDEASGQTEQLQQTMRQLEGLMASEQDPDALPDLLARYGELQETFEQRGGYEMASRREQVMVGLGMAHLGLDRSVTSLSGGEKTRLALAALLLQAPDLLILDEPTNHLDHAGLAWLEAYLASYPHALLVITHDRDFIDRVANLIFEIQPRSRTLQAYHGTYADYLTQRQQQYEAAQQAFTAQRDEMQRLKRLMRTKANNPKAAPFPADGDKFVRWGNAQTAQATRSRDIRDARHRLAQLEDDKLENPAHNWRISFDFDPEELASSTPIRIQGLSKAFDPARPLFTNLTASVQRGERIVLLAPNGGGKTSLLRILMGRLAADAGEVSIAPSARLGYLDQEGETLDPNQTALDAYREIAPGSDKEVLAALHRAGMFTDADFSTRSVTQLSLGQRRKLGLALLIAARANVLLLDEPTNHLDLPSIEALEAALCAFPGAILAVSHDRRFVARVATQVWTLADGRLQITPQSPALPEKY